MRYDIIKNYSVLVRLFIQKQAWSVFINYWGTKTTLLVL